MKAASANLRRWRQDPVAFVKEVLKAEPDAWQVDVLRAFPSNQRMALKACKGPGKSTVMAWCGWNFLLTRPHPKVVATSITGDNLRDGLWAELAKWQQRSELLKQAFTWSAERIVCNDHPETWWASARQWAKGADPSQQANTLAGIHADYVLFLVDEAGGIPDGVVAAAEGGLSTGTETKLFLGGNPTHLSGPLYRACTRERDRFFVKEISGDPDDPGRSPRINLEWARALIKTHGRDHSFVMVNVLGKFPRGQSNTLVSAEVAADASKRVITAAELIGTAKVLGIDVARFGDDRTVFAARRGRVCFPLRDLRSQDTMVVAGNAVAIIRKWKPDAIFVDTIGVGGGVADRLRELGHPVIDVESSSSPIEADPPCLNLRAEMWWKMAEWMKRASIPEDGELIGELCAPTFKFNSSGKIQVESKDDMKKRGLQSPDKADALALTFAYPIQAKAAHPGLEREDRTDQGWTPFGVEPEQQDDLSHVIGGI